MYFLYSAHVVAAIVRSVPRASAGFSRLAASPVPGRAAGADQRVRLVDEQDDRLGRRLHLVDHLPQAVLELALHAGAGLQQADVERAAATRPCSGGGTSPRASARGEALDHGRLADAGLAGQDRVVLAAAHQDVDDLADLLVAAADRIDLALARLLGQVGREPLQRLLLAHLRRRHRAAGLAGRAPAPTPSVAASASSGEPSTMLANSSASASGLIFSNCREIAISALRSDGVLSMPTIRWPVRTCDSPNISVRVDPAALDGVLDVRRQIGDRRRAARQPVERVGDVLGQPRRRRARSAGRCGAGRSPGAAGSAEASAPARRTGCRAACRRRSRPRSPCKPRLLSLPNSAARLISLMQWHSDAPSDNALGVAGTGRRRRRRCAAAQPGRPSQRGLAPSVEPGTSSLRSRCRQTSQSNSKFRIEPHPVDQLRDAVAPPRQRNSRTARA